MGREIRRVPPGWEHPRQECRHSPWAGGCAEAKAHGGQCYQPLHDRSFVEAARAWKTEFAAWERGERPEYCEGDDRQLEFWEWDRDPPDRNYYRPDWPEGAATHYQMYETVSEGTPVSPVFATKEELIDYLARNGDRWDQLRGRGGWGREAAERFVNRGFAMSLMVETSSAGRAVREPRDQ